MTCRNNVVHTALMRDMGTPHRSRKRCTDITLIQQTMAEFPMHRHCSQMKRPAKTSRKSVSLFFNPKAGKLVTKH